MKSINDLLLNIFTGKDILRPVMSYPNLKDGIVYASDGHVLISIPEDELSLEYKTIDNYPNAQRLIDEIEKKNLASIKINVDDIVKELTKARLIVDTLVINCKECKGTGEVEWLYRDKKSNHHTKTDECPLCEGDGGIQGEHPFPRVSLSLIEDDNKSETIGIWIGDIYFHPFQLYRLVMVALANGLDTIEIFYDTNTYGSTITYFGNIKVMVMAMLRPE